MSPWLTMKTIVAKPDKSTIVDTQPTAPQANSLPISAPPTKASPTNAAPHSRNDDIGTAQAALRG